MKLVVAKYKENIKWIDEVNGYEVVIYDKSGSKSKHKKLENIGRESHSYLHFIIENYDNLPEYTVFTQGNPFDHCPMFLKLLEVQKPYWNFDLLTLPTQIEHNRVQRFGATIFDGISLDYTRELFTLFKPNFDFSKPFLVSYFGIFGVSKERILRYSKEQYQKALELHTQSPDIPYIFEMLWRTIYE